MPLFGFPSLIVGLILRYADNPQWFNGAHSVGHILILASLIWIGVWLAIMLLVIAAAAFGSTSSSTLAAQRRRPRRGF